MTKEPWRMVKNHSWNRYKKIITDFLDWDAGRQTITWAKHVNQYLLEKYILYVTKLGEKI